VTIQLTEQQQNALDKVAEWASSAGAGDIFRIFGYAGTGKSTIVERLADIVGRDKVVFTAFTGKACEVLKQKGCPAQTIHSLIYTVNAFHKQRINELHEILLSDRNNVELRKELARLTKESLEPSFGLASGKIENKFEEVNFFIVDECSMIDQVVGEDLLACNKPLIVMGDPGQLPPPKGMGFFTPPNVRPDVLLTEIHRQAENSPILTLATKARKKELLLPGTDLGDAKVITRAKLTNDMVLEADLVIVGANKTRRMYNASIRKLKGFSGMPKKGEQLICLKNNRAKNYQNGGMFEVLEDAEYNRNDDTLQLHLRNNLTGISTECTAWAFHFRDEEPNKPWWEYEGADEFYYGYAITCHKAQGSQADNVVVIDESKFFRDDASKWLYTAITRAAKQVIIAR
jgi:exodeoxyribonuclease-5